METIAEKKLYEGMFLVDSGKAASDWDGVNAAIKKILDRAEAEIVSMRKWDDRRLAYDIRTTSRGTYMLCYFKAEGQKIQGIEKDVQLSENVIRVLILSTDQMTKEDIERDTPATKTEKEKAVAEQPKEAEVSEQGDQPEEPAAEQAQTSDEALTTEQAQIVDEAKTAEDVEQAVETEQAEETEQPEETRKAEDAGQAEEVETEEPQDPQPKVSSDD
ncbi:MAG: 30S ribosomal protein S6 [Planctomycetaceae bacterium]|nr:MAG: 30S ribosomal protein S6 [Planctomycetaceae bacterium]